MTIIGLSVYKRSVPICRARRSNVFGHRHWELMFEGPRFVQVSSIWTARLSIETILWLPSSPSSSTSSRVSIFQSRLICWLPSKPSRMTSTRSSSTALSSSISTPLRRVFQSRLVAGFRANPAITSTIFDLQEAPLQLRAVRFQHL